jgi:octaprenyl-diphosphate synthase
LSNVTGLGRAELPVPDPVVTQDEIFSLISAPLQVVEKMFREHLASPIAIVDEIGDFVASGGGKRVRPTLHLLCSRLVGYRGANDALLATVLEFIHSATLIHDDIIDEAKTRRGRSSVNRRWGNNVTVLFGDYLFAKAMELALQAESLEVMRKLADVTLRMTEGEMLQTRYVGRVDLTVDEYLALIEKKTASLFACCCELAGILADQDAERRQALSTYGLQLGMAFQLVDDVLDFTGDQETLGKPAATDLREGKATLAVIELLESGSLEARELAREVMDGAGPKAIGDLTRMLHESGAIKRARERAQSYADRAMQALEVFDDGPARRALLALPDILLQRTR